MRLPWHRDTRTVYVPVGTEDARPWPEKWADIAFLRQVRGFRGNAVYVELVSQALREVREAADVAQTPEELAGLRVGIRQLKWLLTAAAEAGERLQELEALNVAGDDGRTDKARRSARTGAHAA